ncbi:MAG: response regulator, partial [Acidimicrobiales bacterium]
LALLTSSGGGNHPRPDDARIAAYLNKPVRSSQLHDALARVMTVPAGAPPTAPARPRAPAPRATPAGPRVLVAEDNPVNQKVAAAMLARLGYQADLVANGHEAIEALGRVPYAAILMDCQMPEMDGFEAAEQIRRSERQSGSGRRTPIIALTAAAMKGDEQRCLAAGMDVYVTKPINASELAAVLGEFLGPTPNLAPAPAADADGERGPEPTIQPTV